MNEGRYNSHHASRITHHASRITTIIPTLNAEQHINRIIDSLHEQSLPPDEIVIIDSESDDSTLGQARKYPDVKTLSVRRSEFDHGHTRDIALRSSTGDCIIFLTQDALPADSNFVENITRQFLTDSSIAITTGRQVPRLDAWPFERLVREFNYPSVSRIRSASDIPELGIKTFFASNCCSAYRRDIYERLGGFDFPLKTNEDFLFAARAINAGYKIAYAADAKVIHSHNLTLAQQYRRNFFVGYEIERHKSYFNGVSQEKEGLILVKHVSLELLKHGRVFSFVRFVFDCAARLLGNVMGRRAYRKNLGC